MTTAVFSIILAGTIASATLVPQSSPPLGSRIPRLQEVATAGEQQGVKTLRDFARCFMRKHVIQARALLTTTPGSVPEQQVLKAIFSKPLYCLDAGSMRMKAPIMRGALAEALVDLDPELLGAPLQANPLSQSPEEYIARLQVAQEMSVDPTNISFRVGYWITTCAAAEKPEAVLSYLATASVKKADASLPQKLGDVRRALSACLPTGQTMLLDQTTIRFLLAEAICQRRLASANAKPA